MYLRNLLAATLLVLAPSAANAATLAVCGACSYKTLGAAVTAATAGDTITVAAGTYYEGDITIAKNLTITGAGSATTIITRSSTSTGTSDIIEITSGTVTMSGLTIEPAGYYTSTERALDIGIATVTASDIKISSHESDRNGSAIRVQSGTLHLSNSTIDNVDSTSGVGGGLYATSSTVTLTNVTISNSEADANYGGAIYAQYGTMTITSSTFSGNDSGYDGGAIYADQGTVNVLTSTFSTNTAVNNGGDIRAYYAIVNVTDSDFSNSYASQGGSMRIGDGSTATITGCDFELGDAAWGGHILNYGALTVTGSDFATGTATNAGGHIWLGETSIYTIDDSTFTGGAAPYGGAIYGEYGDLTLTDSTFIGNKGSTSGGALYLTTMSAVDVLRNSICENGAPSGGGAYLTSLSTATPHVFANNVVVENTATANGGGLFVTASTSLDVLNNDILGDTSAVTSGGGLYVSGDADFKNNLVAYTVAGDGLVGSGTTAGIATYSAWYSNTAANVSGTVTLGSTNVTGFAPLLYSYTYGGACDADWWGYQLDSPLRNAGDTGVSDLDGTRSDIGAAGGPYADPAYWVDADGDTYRAVYDCNDGNAAVKPLATETCNSIDDDCDGSIDEGMIWYRDADGDGYGTVSTTSTACPMPSGYVANSTDCNDADNTAYPGATETCDGVDDDCDTTIDEGVKTTYYRDSDGDTYGDLLTTTTACSAPTGYVANSTDCNDASAAVKPGATETCNSIDDNCNSTVDEGVKTTFYRDADSDGFGALATTSAACTAPSGYVADKTDCDDADATIKPTGTEVCNLKDDDCDGTVDDGVKTTFYRDADSDGYGTKSATSDACTAPSGYVASSTDCNDAAVGVNPGATETCDDVDQDCDGVADDGAVDPTTWYADSDGDSYGDAGVSSAACDAPTGYVANDDDCDDLDTNTRPGASEQCNGEDDDCDGTADEAADLTFTDWYTDADADGFGDEGSTPVNDCAAPTGTVDNATDCDDANDAVNPGEVEVCNGIDEDCSGAADDGLAFFDWYPDADADGFGEEGGTPVNDCVAPDDTIDNAEDCDDADVDVNPEQEEVCNGKDDDCDGTIDVDAADPSTWFVDADGDGYGDASVLMEACDRPDGYAAVDGDCDDTNDSAFPAANECANGYDDDCDGSIDEDVVETTWYADADDDGFGVDEGSVVSCEQPDGYAAQAGDCDDAAADAFPGADEVWYDGDDQACDGGSDFDQDGDGHDADDFAGDDCDDLDAAVNPDALEVEDNDVDENCDGSLGEPEVPETSDRLWEAEGGDTDGSVETSGKGCSCDTQGGPSFAWLALVGVAALRRKRAQAPRAVAQGRPPHGAHVMP